ncbi:MAG: hypothetical protein JWQ83_773 [Lacunisphaera sp.]|nr:hypothetical protein [Lacunisphaera sp.]
MLADRSYMQGGYRREGTSIHIWLIAILGAAFIVELVLLSPWWPAGGRLVAGMTMTTGALRNWEVWRLLTHGLLHASHSPFHILFVLFSLYSLGNELVPLLGPKRFLAVFLATIATGGLTWAAVNWGHGGGFIGAVAGVLGLFVVLTSIYPAREIHLMFLPIAFRARNVLWTLIAIDVFGLVLYEIPGAVAPLDFSPSAHLGGMLAGWIYFRFFHANNGWDRAAGLRLPSWLQRRKKKAAPIGSFTLNLGGSTPDIRAEVDRILDKINSQGFGALTTEEKRILDEAKDLLSRQ